MSIKRRSFYISILKSLSLDSGQDAIEYVLLVMLVSFAATVGMRTVATDINKAFGNIGTKVAAYSPSGSGNNNQGGGNHGGDQGGGNQGGGNHGGDQGGGNRGGGGKRGG